jgi:hypothetical protein
MSAKQKLRKYGRSAQPPPGVTPPSRVDDPVAQIGSCFSVLATKLLKLAPVFPFWRPNRSNRLSIFRFGHQVVQIGSRFSVLATKSLKSAPIFRFWRSKLEKWSLAFQFVQPSARNGRRFHDSGEREAQSGCRIHAPHETLIRNESSQVKFNRFT